MSSWKNLGELFLLNFSQFSLLLPFPLLLNMSRELLIKPKPKKKADTIDEAKEIKEGDDATPEETKSEEETKLEEKSEGKSENK